MSANVLTKTSCSVLRVALGYDVYTLPLRKWFLKLASLRELVRNLTARVRPK